MALAGRTTAPLTSTVDLGGPAVRGERDLPDDADGDVVDAHAVVRHEVDDVRELRRDHVGLGAERGAAGQREVLEGLQPATGQREERHDHEHAATRVRRGRARRPFLRRAHWPPPTVSKPRIPLPGSVGVACAGTGRATVGRRRAAPPPAPAARRHPVQRAVTGTSAFSDGWPFEQVQQVLDRGERQPQGESPTTSPSAFVPPRRAPQTTDARATWVSAAGSAGRSPGRPAAPAGSRAGCRSAPAGRARRRGARERARAGRRACPERAL